MVLRRPARLDCRYGSCNVGVKVSPCEAKAMGRRKNPWISKINGRSARGGREFDLSGSQSGNRAACDDVIGVTVHKRAAALYGKAVSTAVVVDNCLADSEVIVRNQQNIGTRIDALDAEMRALLRVEGRIGGLLRRRQLDLESRIVD